MGLREATRATTYTKSAAHRPPSHMTLMEKMLYGSKHPNEVGNQIPGDLACKTGAVGTVRQLRGFSMASM
jgi:hypothetical protein